MCEESFNNAAVWQITSVIKTDIIILEIIQVRRFGYGVTKYWFLIILCRDGYLTHMATEGGGRQHGEFGVNPPPTNLTLCLLVSIWDESLESGYQATAET